MSLKALYGKLLLSFGLREFEAREACKLLESENPYLVLHRLWKAGYIVRVSRGVFRAIHPVIMAMEWAGYRWRSRISRTEYLPLLERLVVKLIEGFGEKLMSIILFGSMASGRMRPESDIDLLIVAEKLPESYSERLKLLRKMTAGVEEEAIKLWREKKIYPLIDPIILTPEEASKIQPFYLDLLENSIIIYDKDGFMERILEGLKDRLRKLRSRKVLLPNGSWYWIVKPDAKAGEVIEV